MAPEPRAPPPAMAARVSCRYIGAYTWQTWENRAACACATAVSSGSMVRSAFVVGWALTVGYT